MEIWKVDIVELLLSYGVGKWIQLTETLQVPTFMHNFIDR